MAGSSPPSSEYIVEMNSPGLDERVSIAFIVIDTLFLLVFYLSRYFNPKAVGVPMLVCNTLCYVFCIGSATVGILMVRIGGVGYHVAAVPVTTFQTWLQLSKALEFTYTPAVMFAKLAALFLYYQVFEVPAYRRIIVGIGVIVVLQGVVFLILAFFICRPFRYFWTQALQCPEPSHGYRDASSPVADPYQTANAYVRNDWLHSHFSYRLSMKDQD
ncbi:integral membrane protein [Colletotrichum nymphaeae SA-01]|uniref:Integral membrane protein n=1 Tax=Colletotrichum nymphaeae SA-01 TaxID=1460502 RepID=A0A135S5K5_9PEZI|nr:integral membrane protein [Colletotrichum nymphaeae SA-01]